MTLADQQPTTTLKSDRTRRQIMLAAIEVVQDCDLEAVRFAHIAKVAGVSRATIYNYFDSPDEVFEALAAKFRQDILVFLDRIESEVADPLLRIAVGVTGILRRVEAEPQWGTFAARWREPESSLVTQAHVVRWVEQAAQDSRTEFEDGWSVEVAFILRGVTNFALSPHDPPVASMPGRTRIVVLLLRSLGVNGQTALGIADSAESAPGMDLRFFV